MKEILIRPKLGEAPFNDNIFESSDRPLREHAIYGRYWACALRDVLEELGYELKTVDLGNVKEAEYIIFVSMHRDKFFWECYNSDLQEKMVLFEVEFPTNDERYSMRKDGDYPTQLYRDCFGKVLTWNEKLVETKERNFESHTKQILKVNRPNNYYRGAIEKVPFGERKLCVMMNSNKYSEFPLELYSERREAVKFFQEACPDGFDLFGSHWDRSVVRYFTNRLPFLTFNPNGLMRRIELGSGLCGIVRWALKEEELSKCYRGWTDSPFTTFSKYRFAVIYEVIGGMRGSVSSKMFDCLQSGCIPIYLGASNVEEYVWADLFIDKRKLDYTELLELMESFEEEQFEEFLVRRSTFLSSYDGARFFERDWAYEFVEALLK